MVDSDGHFAWYELITTDMEAAKAFYTKVMGWDAHDASAPDRAYTLFSSGKTVVSGLMNLPDDSRKAGGKPFWIGYVRVSDVDAAADRVKRLGGAVYIPPTDIPDISRFSIFADPQTATLALLKSLSPDGGPRPEMGAGRIVWHELLAGDWHAAWPFYSELFDWQKADVDADAMGTYQPFSAGGQTIGGMRTKPPMIDAPFWLYYFNIDDIDAAAKRVTAGGGQILDGPLELSGGVWIVQCADPQGAMFALEGKRRHEPVGYFERVASRGPSDARGRRWSW